MPSSTQTPRDLAAFVFGKLSSSGSPPALSLLEEAFEVIFLASLHTEEAAPVISSLAYVNPRKPDPSPPRRQRMNRWRFTPFRHPVAFDLGTLCKLAFAADVDATALAIYSYRNRLQIVGMIDQQHTVSQYRRYEAEGVFEPPGMFQVRIVGVGHIAVSAGLELIAELKGGTLIHESVDVFDQGPVLEALLPGVNELVRELTARANTEGYSLDNQDSAHILDTWISVYCRILGRAKAFGHGGIVIVTPDPEPRHFDAKYSFEYPKLREALSSAVSHSILEGRSMGQIITNLDSDNSTIPTSLYLDEAVHGNERSDAIVALEGAIALVAGLTRVDGAIVMGLDFRVRGFGWEILPKETPSAIFLSRTARLVQSRCTKINPHSFGTRHLSVFRYCSEVPGSVGFVISQDGLVRAVTKVKDRVAMWSNIALSRHVISTTDRKFVEVRR